MLEKDIDYIVWDLETTGFVAPKDKILEIGCLINKNGEIERKRWVLDNQCEIPQKITEINGFTKEIIEKEGRDPKECLLEFLPYFDRCKNNITHNGIRFDIIFLTDYAEYILNLDFEEKKHLKDLIYSNAVDTAVYFKSNILSMNRKPDETYLEFADKVMNTRIFGLKYNLGLVCDDMNIDRTNIIQHRALGDVELTHEIYKKIC